MVGGKVGGGRREGKERGKVRSECCGCPWLDGRGEGHGVDSVAQFTAVNWL